MDIENVNKAIEVLAQIALGTEKLTVHTSNGSQMHRHLLIAQLYLMEYAKHLSDGMPPVEALLATAAAKEAISE